MGRVIGHIFGEKIIRMGVGKRVRVSVSVRYGVWNGFWGRVWGGSYGGLGPPAWGSFFTLAAKGLIKAIVSIGLDGRVVSMVA